MFSDGLTGKYSATLVPASSAIIVLYSPRLGASAGFSEVQGHEETVKLKKYSHLKVF